MVTTVGRTAVRRKQRLALVVVSLWACLECSAASDELASHPAAKGDALNARIARIENAFEPISMGTGQAPLRLNLEQVMRISNVPGLSVAVVDNYKIAWAKGYGVTERGGGTPVTTHTVFPACSVTKPITAVAALYLVEQGKLSLDEDVNLKLKSWKVPENEFTRQQRVTLRRILTHTSGATVHGFYGYQIGQPLPTLVQILNGDKPANSEPVRVDFVPGAKQRYSGGGYLIAQQLMQDATGKAFPQLMQDLVFRKLGLKDSTFEQPLPAARAGAAVSGHQRTGEVIPGQWNVIPEMAAGGLWTTPSDLARIAIELALSSRGRSNRVLSAGMAREMLRLQVDPKMENVEGGPAMRMGLGWMLGDESDPGRFEHGGVNVGFKAQVIMWDDGHGVVVMWNNWSFESDLVVRYLTNAIANEYGWRYRVTPYTPSLYANTAVLAVAKLRGTQAALAKYHELKKRSAEQKGTGKLDVVWSSDPPDYPPSEWDLLGLAQVLADPDHLDDALEVMRVEIAEYPMFPRAYQTLAELYERAGRKAMAVQAYEKLLELQPDDHDAAGALERLKQTK